jgi:hypothetical protein
MTLSTMAFMEFLDGADRASRFFANLPEVAAALDTVFELGDYNGNGVVDETDNSYWRTTFGSRQFLAAEGNIDGVIDAADYVVWRKMLGLAGAGAGNQVPEPGLLSLAAVCAITAAFRLTVRADRALCNGA